MNHTPITPFSPDKPNRYNNNRVEYHLTAQDMLELFQAGARLGYDSRSKMAGAPGTNAPSFEEFMTAQFPKIFI